MSDPRATVNQPGDETPELSIVVPCYNEEAVLEKLFTCLAEASLGWGVSWEVICVDDGSVDRTWDLLTERHAVDPRWKAVSLARNFGQQTAISAGLFHARGRAVVVLDADLQDPPEVIVRFLEKWRSGFEVVYAIRVRRRGGWFKRVSYWLFYRLLARSSSLPIPRDSGDFCLMDRRVVDVLKSMPERSRFLRGLRVWSGFRQVGIEYQRPLRAAGSTKYTFSKLIGLAFDGIFSFSDLPLRLALILGMSVSVGALILLALVLGHWVLAGTLVDFGHGTASDSFIQAVAIVFIGGVQLLCTGLLGEYIGRVYDEVKRRPQWIVREAAGVRPESPPL